MSAPHFFDAQGQPWTPHPTIPGILTKPLETRATYPAASVQLVQVAAGGVIGRHTHAVETETAYVLAGEGVLQWGDEERALTPGTGVTIPPGIPHSLRNTGEAPMEIYAVHIPPVR